MSIVIPGNTPTAGGAAYGDGTNIQFTSAGTSGQVLTSAGAGAPTWASIVSGAQGFVTQATGINAPPGGFIPNDIIALI